MSNLIHVSHRRHGHPLLVAGIIVGLIAGIFLAIPKKIRGWVILLFFTLVAGFWFGWAAHRDQAMAGTTQPVAVATPNPVRDMSVGPTMINGKAYYNFDGRLLDTNGYAPAPRAELVRLPDK